MFVFPSLSSQSLFGLTSFDSKGRDEEGSDNGNGDDTDSDSDEGEEEDDGDDEDSDDGRGNGGSDCGGDNGIVNDNGDVRCEFDETDDITILFCCRRDIVFVNKFGEDVVCISLLSVL